MSWAREHPGAWARLAVAKLGYLFGLEGREHAWVYGHAYFGERSSTTVRLWSVLLLVSFPLLVVAAALDWCGPTGRVRRSRRSSR